MNLFRSEEHARRWARFHPDTAHLLRPLSYWLERFSLDRHRNRGRQDYVSWRTAQPS